MFRDLGKEVLDKSPSINLARMQCTRREVMADNTSTYSGRVYSLSEQIRASTILVHSQLNRLIIARLPLALPPQAADASTYVFGLLHVTLIYTTFESLWASFLETSCPSASLENSHTSHFDELETHALQCQFTAKTLNSGSAQVVQVDLEDVSSRMMNLLARLRIPRLLRSSRLRSDIRSISGMSEHKLDEHVEELSSSGKVAEFAAHMQQFIRASPHLLLAYAWVFYMALFSGGRFIRKSVQAAGPDFWTKLMDPYVETDSLAESLSRDHSIHFLNFSGNEDGEDIKQEFRIRFAEAEAQLTEEEKGDIILESQKIFSYMTDIVTELHRLVEIRKKQKSGNPLQPR